MSFDLSINSDLIFLVIPFLSFIDFVSKQKKTYLFGIWMKRFFEPIFLRRLLAENQ